MHPEAIIPNNGGKWVAWSTSAPGNALLILQLRSAEACRSGFGFHVRTAGAGQVGVVTQTRENAIVPVGAKIRRGRLGLRIKAVSGCGVVCSSRHMCIEDNSKGPWVIVRAPSGCTGKACVQPFYSAYFPQRYLRLMVDMDTVPAGTAITISRILVSRSHALLTCVVSRNWKS